MNNKELNKHNQSVSDEYKKRREKNNLEKKKAKEVQQKTLLEPNIKDGLIIWKDKHNDGSVYEGSFGKEKCFEIKRGIISFTLKTIHKELKTDIKNNSSTELIKLQEKANKILWNNPEFLLKFKPVSQKLIPRFSKI